MGPARYPTIAALALCLLLVAGAASPQTSLPLEIPDNLVAVELATVGLSPSTGIPVVLLREPESGDVVPILIGPAEAQAILFALHQVPTPRPMTHDLMTNLLMTLDATLERVLVYGLVDNTYLGALELRVEGREEPLLVDTRPSDGLALAVRTGAAILVAPEILVAGRDLDYEGLGSGQVVTALGVTVVEASDAWREALDLPGDLSGVVVSRVAGEAAESGLAAGALITAVNGEVPENPMEFLELVRRTPAGERARLDFWQDGESGALTLSTEVPAVRPGEAPMLGV